MVNDVAIEIVTHDGPFHADDVLAVAILQRIYKTNNLVRTRDQDIIDQADFVVDVGSVYDHDLRRYDHHMRVPPNDGRNHVYSSAGLIWKHYAKSYLRAIGIPSKYVYKNDTIDVHSQIIGIMKHRWINPIDLNDNGIIHTQTPISDVVGSLAPIISQKTPDGYDRQFDIAVGMVSTLFERACFHCVEKIIKQYQFNTHKPSYLHDGKIMVSQYEVSNFKYFSESDVHFVIYPVSDFREEGSTYWIARPIYQSVSGLYKTPVPEHLLGLGEEDLNALSLKDILFVHHSGFMTRARTVQAAIGFCESLINTQSQSS